MLRAGRLGATSSFIKCHIGWTWLSWCAEYFYSHSKLRCRDSNGPA